MELTPRTLDDDDVTVEEGDASSRPPRSRRRTRRRWAPLVVLAVVVLGLGALVYKGLNDAALYFRSVDEAVAQRDELGTKRFRLQGTVVGEPTVEGDDVRFEVAFGGAVAEVDHVGAPPDMFRPGIPVVLEGHWADDSDVFEATLQGPMSWNVVGGQTNDFAGAAVAKCRVSSAHTTAGKFKIISMEDPT